MKQLKMHFVFFGSSEIARKCLAYLISAFPASRISVVTEKSYGDIGSNVYGLALKNNLEIVDFSGLKKRAGGFDYGFSVRFHKIIPADIINKFKFGIINMHGGLLPGYRGSASHIFALINEEKDFGATLHFIDKGIDTGPIILRKSFPITHLDTGFDLLEKGKEIGFELFCKILGMIAKGRVLPRKVQVLSEGHTYSEGELKKYQVINLFGIERKELLKRLKAFYHPRKNSVYAKIEDAMVHLKLITPKG